MLKCSALIPTHQPAGALHRIEVDTAALDCPTPELLESLKMGPSIGTRRFSLQIWKDVCAGALPRIHVTYSLDELVQAPAIVSDSSVSAPFLFLPVVKCLAELGNRK
jgi:hypothetical protein